MPTSPIMRSAGPGTCPGKVCFIKDVEGTGCCYSQPPPPKLHLHVPGPQETLPRPPPFPALLTLAALPEALGPLPGSVHFFLQCPSTTWSLSSGGSCGLAWSLGQWICSESGVLPAPRWRPVGLVLPLPQAEKFKQKPQDEVQVSSGLPQPNTHPLAEPGYWPGAGCC